MEELNIEEELKKVKDSFKKLSKNSEELDLILNAIAKKSNKLNYLDRAVLAKQFKKHMDLEDKINDLGK